MGNAGARLKKIRLEKGISLEEVTKKTKINPEILKSLEEDAFVNVSPVYIKGFLKMYCQFLGLDPAEYLWEHKGEESLKPLALEEKVKMPSRTGVPQKSMLSPQVVSSIVAIVVLLVVVIGLASIVKFIIARHKTGARRSHALVTKSKPNLPRRPLALARAQKTAIPQATAKSGKNISDSQAVSDASLRVGIQAMDDCWIQAKVDGKVVFQTVLKKGRSESWAAQEKVELTLGSAGSVRLEVNGKMYDSLGKKGQVLKNFVITRDGGVGGAAK